MGAPFGNKNSSKEKRIFGSELRKAVAQDDRKRLRAAIEKQLDAAAAGDLAALKEIADRLDGKAAQPIETGPSFWDWMDNLSEHDRRTVEETLQSIAVGGERVAEGDSEAVH